jgi:aspartyl-tRNA synthetase
MSAGAALQARESPCLPYNRKIVTLDFLGSLRRTQMCGELRAEHAGQNVVLMGWVNRRRDHGGLIFLDLRDRSGITQVVVDEKVGAAHDKADAARSEYVVAVKGHVRLRGAGLDNPNMPTGQIEVVADELLLLNEAKTPPFSPAEDAIANEEVRLKYRYLDLRRVEMQKNFALRSRVAMAIRNYLVGEGFLEIETPFMTKSTPEGARDYLVPSRIHAGEFYALPQSPQIFKQILMISGFDRYFQVARCFRDEDLRADRQPEFTQIDLEMSFPTQDAVFRVAEGFLTAAFATAGISLTTPFVRMTYDDAVKNYGIDKPDMRLPAMVSLTDELTPELREKLKIEQALPVLGFVIPGVGELSGTARKALLSEVRAGFGDCGLDLLDVARLKTNADFAPLAGVIEAKLGDSNPTRDGEAVTNGALSSGADLLTVVTPKLGTPAMWNYDPQWIWKRVGQLRLQLGAKFADRHRGRFQVHLGHRFPHVRVERGDQDLGRGASSLHFAARGRHQGRAADHGQRRGARAGVRHCAERHGAGVGVDPYPSPGRAGGDLPLTGHERCRGQGTVRVLPRCAGVRHASARWHRAGA